MRRWTLRSAAIVLACLALTLVPATSALQAQESVGPAWDFSTFPVLPSSAPDPSGRPPIFRGQDALGYALPDVILPTPLGSTRPEEGFLLGGSYVMYSQTIPLGHQIIAKRGFLDVTGEITGTPNTPVGLQRKALDTDQVTGPQSQQPGFRIFGGYRFADGSALEISWLHLATQRYTAVATPIPVDFKLRPDLADSFLFSPVSNYPIEFSGPANDTSSGGAFGVWNAADLMTISYTQRNEIYEMVYRLPAIIDTLEWRTYGFVGPRMVWFWEMFQWRSFDLDINGASSDVWNGYYRNIVSNRMYGLKIGCGNDWYIGNGFSCEVNTFVTPLFDIVRKDAKYERGDRYVGPERKRTDRDYVVVPEVGVGVSMNWFPYEGIQVKASYNFMGYFNTLTSKEPVDFDYSAINPEYNRLFFRQLHGFEVGLMLKF